MRANTRGSFVATVATLLAGCWIGYAFAAETVTVSLSPPSPEAGQDITVIISGTRDRTPLGVTDVSHAIVGNQVNVFATILEGGSTGINTPFSFSVDIGKLPAGAFHLVYVQSFDNGFGDFPDSVTNLAFFVAAPVIPTLQVWAIALLAAVLSALSAIFIMRLEIFDAANRRV